MKITKILSLVLALVLVAGLAGCGSKAEAEKATDSNETVVVKIGVVGEDVEMWPAVIEKLKPQGIEVELVKYDDYSLPNQFLSEGDIDLNAFQHYAYLNEEIASKGYDIVSIGETYISPINLYSQKISDISEIKEGDKIAIPNDTTNGGRALKVLEQAELIKLDPEKGYLPEVRDITENPLNLEIIEADAANIYSLLPDVAAGLINGNFALGYDLDPVDDAIFVEKFGAGNDNPYINVIVARTEDKDNEVYKKVVEAYQSQEVIDVFNTEYKGYYLPGWVKE